MSSLSLDNSGTKCPQVCFLLLWENSAPCFVVCCEVVWLLLLFMGFGGCFCCVVVVFLKTALKTNMLSRFLGNSCTFFQQGACLLPPAKRS